MLALGRPLTSPTHLPVPGRAPPCPPANEAHESRDGSRTVGSSSAGGEPASPSFPLPASPPASGGSAEIASPYEGVDRTPFVYGVPVEDAGPDPHHKGKWYAIRRGCEIGVVSSWERCKPLVIGFQGTEYRSFLDLNEARSWVLEGKREALSSRKQCRVQFSSFVGGQALRTLADIIQEGCADPLQVLCCLDSGSDVNLALRTLFMPLAMAMSPTAGTRLFSLKRAFSTSTPEAR